MRLFDADWVEYGGRCVTISLVLRKTCSTPTIGCRSNAAIHDSDLHRLVGASLLLLDFAAAAQASTGNTTDHERHQPRGPCDARQWSIWHSRLCRSQAGRPGDFAWLRAHS